MATISLQHVYHTTQLDVVCKLAESEFSLTVHVADRYVNTLEKNELLACMPPVAFCIPCKTILSCFLKEKEKMHICPRFGCCIWVGMYFMRKITFYLRPR